MTMIRRELPRSLKTRIRDRSHLSHRTAEGSPFDSRPIRSLGQRGPDKTGEFTGDGGDDVLFGFAAGGQPLVSAMESMLRRPGVGNDGGWGAALPLSQGVPAERMATIMPGGFDQDAPQVGIAGFGNAAAGLSGPTGVFGRHEADKRHGARGGRKAPWIAEFGSDGERGQVVDAAEATQPRDPWPQRLEIE
jgi:hypothetical protein